MAVLLIAIVVLVAFEVLALRFGFDSRDGHDWHWFRS
jgi:hypothetical protein